MEIDISCGLPADIDIHCDGEIIPQRIDFQGVPFRCSCCRSTGHLRKNCPSLRRSSPSSGSSAHFEEPATPHSTPASDKVRRASFLPISACDNVNDACALFDDAYSSEIAYLDSFALGGATKATIDPCSPTLCPGVGVDVDSCSV